MKENPCPAQAPSPASSHPGCVLRTRSKEATVRRLPATIITLLALMAFCFVKITTAYSVGPKMTITNVSNAGSPVAPGFYVIPLPEEGDAAIEVTITGAGTITPPHETCKLFCPDMMTVREAQPPEVSATRYLMLYSLGVQPSVDEPTVEVEISHLTEPGVYTFAIIKKEEDYICTGGFTGTFPPGTNDRASDTVTLIVATVNSIKPNPSHGKHLKVVDKVDLIGTVAGGSGDLELQAELNPNTAESRKALTWTGATQSADRTKAKIPRAGSALVKVEALIGGVVKRKADVYKVWVELKFDSTGPIANYPDSSVFPGQLSPGTAVWGTGSGLQNGMLIEGTIFPAGFGDVANATGVTLDFMRTKTMARWARASVALAWQLQDYEDAGTSDEVNENDEDKTPANDHIYSQDAPGRTNDMAGTMVEAVHKLSMIEYVNINFGGGWRKCSNDMLWHSIDFLVAKEDDKTKFVKDVARSEIALGAIAIDRKGNP